MNDPIADKLICWFLGFFVGFLVYSILLDVQVIEQDEE